MQIFPNAIPPEYPQYNEWNDRGFNHMFKGLPDYIIPVSTIDELKEALQKSVQSNQYLMIRGGGHCLEDFVANPDVKVIIDISKIKGVRFDHNNNSFEVMAGETVGEMLQKLFTGWGVVLPVGEHPNIGIGGHISGGAFGFLCRQFGLAVDYLYAVELLWVNEFKTVQSVIATNEPDDQNRELWWAHTGGGAGNFGIATRYWFRIPDVEGDDPALILPKAPSGIETFEVDWQWKDIDESIFRKLVGNFGGWCYQNAAPGIPANGLFCTLHLWNKQAGKIQLKGLISDPMQADLLISDIMESIQQGVNIPYTNIRKKMSWLDFALRPFQDIFVDAKGSFKLKDAFLLKPFTDTQLEVIYKHLSTEKDTPGGLLGLATYGGMVNAIAPSATASFQRNAILTTASVSGWIDPKEKEKYLKWVRAFYHDLFAQTGGVPVPNEMTGGCIIAHPDSDLHDPRMNKSGVPWHRFYYQDNYPRLQKVKAKWDPLNIFHHSLSIQP
ncbi:MAG TPA: FAD-binding protein [Puia sp.]|nr:FAD-binding protein [Puia sp.]